MNYQFRLEEWMDQFPPKEVHGHYSGDDITSPCDICNNEWLRRGLIDEYDWGESVPVDIFVMSFGEPENRFATKIGGLPYRDESVPWPQTSSGRSMALLAQFNFSNSHDIVGDLPAELLLVFGDDSEGLPQPMHFEWQPLGLENLVRVIPSDAMEISPCFGNICRTVSFPNAVQKTDSEYPQCHGKDVWSSYWIPSYQATQIGRAPFFIQPGDDEGRGVLLCTIASVQPDAHRNFPWVNVEEPLCAPGEWRFGGTNLMIGDLGCIHIFIDEDSDLHAVGSCF